MGLCDSTNGNKGMGCNGKAGLIYTNSPMVGFGPKSDLDHFNKLIDADGCLRNVQCQLKSAHLEEPLEASVRYVEIVSTRWADMCSEEADNGTTVEQEAQKLILNAIVLADEVMKSLSILGSGIDADEKNCLIEEKIIEIARIIGISVEGRIEEIRACIQGMIAEEFGSKKGYENC